jgi:hypothetical protein
MAKTAIARGRASDDKGSGALPFLGCVFFRRVS